MKTLIVGGAACVWDDVAQAREFGPYDQIIVLNHMIRYWVGRIDIFATLHPELLWVWSAERNARGMEKPKLVAAHTNNASVGRPNAYPVDIYTDYRWSGMSGSGTSSLFGVKVAIERWPESRIVLCGCPMDAQAGSFTGAGRWSDPASYREAWKIALPRIEGQVRSVSGWTADLLGKPTKEWVSG